ncbi:K(+)-transporting ATPase subunit F [Sciscionella marina]|nr:K(+)-transporting ATPase subunit F [Sciscionella marina]
MSGVGAVANIIGGILGLALIGYLAFALLRPEKF